ncbi:hypothetical protein [Streptomyces collinus]|uniref:hypothetical protein n=1 Tax=Streptomyces collinus TaxID=42684 RepID=UPI002943596B|nr:hypothetical protein [Streptomyces collinus]
MLFHGPPGIGKQKAFGTKLSTWKDARTGRAFYANDSAPTLPGALASWPSRATG